MRLRVMAHLGRWAKMKTPLFILAFPFSAAVFGRPTSQFARTDRILTVEVWSRHEATVWAVQPDQIVVYRRFETEEPDSLVGQFSISPERLRKIREETAAVRQIAQGILFWQGGLLHGPLLRLSFTDDGSLAGTRIEFGGVFEDWLRPICAAISDAAPGMPKVEFEAAAQARRDMLARTGNVPPTIRTPIADYYCVELSSDSRPNQMPEPTSGSVTPRADARVAPPPPVAHR